MVVVGRQPVAVVTVVFLKDFPDLGVEALLPGHKTTRDRTPNTVASQWNGLTTQVVSAESLSNFKRSDKFMDIDDKGNATATTSRHDGFLLLPSIHMFLYRIMTCR